LVGEEANRNQLSFDEFFNQATGHIPYPFQRRFGCSEDLPELIDIPTGLGKTDMVVLGWLWRRRFSRNDGIRHKTPRRLVYCLPMRTLVEQTGDKAKKWLENLGILAESPGDDRDLDGWCKSHGFAGKRISVTILMGGESKDEWDHYPERDSVIIGTQDMLLSRALNRGYGMSRYRWPVHFGLLNNDCLWLMDEVQLMGRGLATTAQLQAFRNRLGTIDSLPTNSIWMSATLQHEWLATVDFDPETNLSHTLALSPEERSEENIKTRIEAVKFIKKSKADSTDPKALAENVLDKHRPSSRTLVVLNTVGRAVALHRAISRKKPDAELVLVHSRFRPPDRTRVVSNLLKDPDQNGTIIISTQVVEAGVDVSARVMFTEIAPWSSLVQRFGRCNRSGKYSDAEVYWIDIPTEKSGSALPYTEDELDRARQILQSLEGQSVGPSKLPKIQQEFKHVQVIRLKDMLELFDTTPDLAGNDVDISRFIRETSDTDVQVFWRDLSDQGPNGEEPEPGPHRSELCSVPVGEIRDLIIKGTRAWAWDSLDGRWISASSDSIYPGRTILLDSSEGHYTEAEGWNIASKLRVPTIATERKDSIDDTYSSNEMAAGGWMSISEHTDLVSQEMALMLDTLMLDHQDRGRLLDSARWHDAGKAHRSFQAMIKKDELDKFTNPPAAKAPREAWLGRVPAHPILDDERRKYFRHELASGIAALLNGNDDLTAYLAAAHHGKVRLSIRSMPGEFRPPNDNIRFARGVWDGDTIPETDLGGGVVMPATTIDMSFMELGISSSGPSWLSRTLALRDRPNLGPFRLAFFEALMKAADERASGGGA